MVVRVFGEEDKEGGGVSWRLDAGYWILNLRLNYYKTCPVECLPGDA
ncbi:MAG: hypothetical protein IIC76_04275 [Bacteroidetes bacterium]|nr:hypothetical protein [Bacteroidota bacterium]